MNIVIAPRPGGVPAGASWFTKSSLITCRSALTSFAGKISSSTRRASALLAVLESMSTPLARVGGCLDIHGTIILFNV